MTQFIVTILSLILPVTVVVGWIGGHIVAVWMLLLWFFQTVAPDATTVIGALTPVVVWGVTWAINKYIPNINNIALLILVVPVMSLGVTWITNLLASTDNHLSWVLQTILGLLAVVIDQVIAQVKRTKSPPAQ